MKHMSEEDLQLLITLDDPWDAQEEDTFNHLQAENIVAWPGQPFPETELHDHRAEAVIHNDPYKVASAFVINDQNNRRNEV